MTTATTVTTKRQVVLPKDFCERANIRPGTSLRVREINGGLFVKPIAEPSEKELKAIFRELDRQGATHTITPTDEAAVVREIRKYRDGKKRRRTRGTA